MFTQGQEDQANHFLKAGMIFQEQGDAHLNHAVSKTCFSNTIKLVLKYMASVVKIQNISDR